MPETAKRTARVPILGEDGRISDDYIPAAIGEGVESAEAAAKRAETAATAAEGSATAAGQSAAGAQGSASAANASATQAQQSATTASGAATSAQSAQTAAEAAKAVAESARDSAQTAASQAQQSAASVADKFIASAQATTLEPGSQATASVESQVLTIGVPKGDKGDPGEKGDPGDKGDPGEAATVTVGATTTGEAGTEATVSNSGTTSAAVLNFTIPRGDKGDKGDTGDQGVQGEKGDPGTAATIAVGSVTGLAAGASPTVANSGTANAAVLDFGIPKGDKGDKGDPGQDGQDATLPEGMVTADGVGVLSRLGSGEEPSIMTNIIVGNTANSTSATMSTSGNSPNVSVINSQTKAGVSFGLVDGEPVLTAGKPQSGTKVYGFSPTIPEDDTLTVVTSDAYKADTDHLKQRIAELENQAANVVTGTSTDLVSHGEDAFPQKPREVRIKGKTWVNRLPVIEGTQNGITVSTDETGLVTANGTAAAGTVIVGAVNGVSPGKTVTALASSALSQSISDSCLWLRFRDSENGLIGSVNQFGFGRTLSITVTVPSNAVTVEAVVSVFEGKSVNWSGRVMLVDGTEVPDCFTPCASITSVEMGKLVTAGKNLLDFSKFNSAYYAVSDGGLKIVKPDDQAWANIQPILQIRPGDYILSCAGARSTQIATRNVGDTVWKSSSSSSHSLHLSVLSEIAVKVFANVGTVVYPQLELGSTATAYEPPTVTTNPLPEVELRSLPNGTCDELVIKEDGTCEVERKTGYIASYTDEEVTGEYVSTGNGLEAGASIVYELDEPTTEPQSPVTLPALPAPTFNQYHDASVPSDTSTEYVRDINIVIDNLAKQVAGTAATVAINEATR